MHLIVLTPVVIKAEEAAKLYNIMRHRQVIEIDHEVNRKIGFTQQTRLKSQKTR